MIKVFKANDLIKYFIKIIIPIIIIFILFKFLNGKAQASLNPKGALLFCIDDTVETINLKKLAENTDNNNSKIKAISISELKVFDSVITNNIAKNDNDITSTITEGVEQNNENNKTENDNIIKAQTDVKTEIVNTGINPKTTDEYNGVKINNSTKYTLTEDMLNPDSISVNKNKILIYHTHTCESYTPTEQNNYEASGTFRTIDLNYSVARVGDELTNQLKSYGCNVIHNTTYHDYPAYNGSYSRSLQTAQDILKDNSDTDIVIDLHRDAIADETYAPKVKIGEEYASQLMFVMGSNTSNSAHKNWNDNFKFAIKVQRKANELYPGLFKPIILRNSEYNQHIAKAACIIEVGATGNTLEESMNSMKYLAKILEEF